MIDILIPVLGRPQNAQKVVGTIKQSTTVEHTIMFLCSLGDDEQIQACVDTGEVDLQARSMLYPQIRVMQWPPGPGDYARKINAGFDRTYNEFIFTAADDVEFTPGWDIEILKVAERTGAGVVGSNDDANPTVKRGNHSTHTLFRRSYIDSVGATFFDGPGVVYHEGYEHQWVDTEAVKAAKDRGEWAFARRSVVRHHHPFFDKTVRMDNTYRKALGDASHDSALYRQRLQTWTRQNRQR